MDYCLRLDDACPQMNAEKWKKMESILDEYKIKPIVGVIPENRDPDFVSVADENFWGKACEWQKKGWTIALHGLHHELYFHEPRGYYQLSHSRKTEWAGRSSTEQYEMLKQGSLFRSADEIMEKYDSVKNQGILGKIIELVIYFLRGIKGSKE